MEMQQEFDIKKYLALLYKKKNIFVAILVIVTSISIAVSYRMPRIYEAKSTVLIERNIMNELTKGITVTPSVQDRARAVEVIMKSRYLILQVMKDLDIDLTKKNG